MKIDLEGLTKHISGTGEFIKIDQNKCNGCGLCVKVCIANLWGFQQSIAYIRDDYKEKCLECGSCYTVCEPGAIKFQYPAGGTGVIYEKG
ncbi:MAG: indolepyruvate ferredoxin oxidoreductase subunit alpha [Candidatus Hermodarchaeota archaeon]